jgi:formamidopyrimidine-DNA glycosylase
MPELPDITVYLEALERRIAGQTLEKVRVGNPFVIRTTDPPLNQAFGQKVTALQRMGKRIAIGLENDIWLVLHLMIAGRLHWAKAGAKLPGRRGLAAFDFASGSVILTEAGSQHRASLHVVRDPFSLDAGGIDVMSADLGAFRDALTAANHTLKRSLTDPRIFSGIGNAYSDEILHHAGLSPVLLTQKMTAADIEKLHVSTKIVLLDWIERLRAEAGEGFPERVTAFREDMAVHGRYGQPCPRCGAKVQRIRYAGNETNYCVNCQTGGKLLADRGLSRLLRKDWPRTLEELEALKERGV